MNKITVFTILALGLLCMDLVACPTPIRRTVVVTPVIPVVTPVIAIPTYAASYNGYGQQGLTEKLLQEILDELKALRSEVPTGNGGTFQSVVQTKCAACHTEGKTVAGTEFVLLSKEGNVVPLSLQEKKLIALRTNTSDLSQRMPPNGQLGDREKKLIATFTKGNQ